MKLEVTSNCSTTDEDDVKQGEIQLELHEQSHDE
jgi:hypothetical protein